MSVSEQEQAANDDHERSSWYNENMCETRISLPKGGYMMRKIVRGISVLLACSMILCACSKADTDSNNGVTVTKNLEEAPVLVGDIP